ncbi:MepB family protein [Vagococcus sp. CY53-2]|nr:MepB family protein [Vagococcus sp. CY53-2]MCI0130302.1 MepB family protein [Vagococcus sp. CY53-2]
MFVQSLPYINHHFHSPSLINEEQNAEYEGVYFYHDTKSYRSRLANKTPKKAGYFVSFWEKMTNQKIKRAHLKKLQI